MSDRSGSFQRRYGPWAVVTGASDGIGLAFAKELAGAGLKLVLVARNLARLRDVAAALHRDHGVECRVVAADLSDPEQVRSMMESTRELDVGLLVAAAGFGTSGALLAADIGIEAQLVDLNCKSVLLQCSHFGRRFAAGGRGGVVLMSSVMAFSGAPLAANYAASKAYVQSLAEGLRKEWASAGIDVIASAPGPIASGFAARANLRMARAMTPEVVARGTLAALGRKGTVRPGWLSKLLGWSLAAVPRPMRAAIWDGVMRKMTAHQDETAGPRPAAKS